MCCTVYLLSGRLRQALGHAFQLQQQGLHVVSLVRRLQTLRAAWILSQWKQKPEDGAHFLLDLCTGGEEELTNGKTAGATFDLWTINDAVIMEWVTSLSATPSLSKGTTCKMDHIFYKSDLRIYSLPKYKAVKLGNHKSDAATNRTQRGWLMRAALHHIFLLLQEQ